MTLKDYQIEDRDEQKYCVPCSKCSTSRKKQGTKSLMVYKDEDGTRFECLHPSCEWYQNRQFIPYEPGSSGPVTPSALKINFVSPIPDDVGPPPFKNNKMYTYKNQQGQILYYVIRVERGPGDKYFFPVAYTAEGEWVTKKPPIKALYGAEFFDPSKNQTVVVEGEKARDAAAEIFTQANVVCWQGGAPGIKSGDWDMLRGQNVVLWPDNDEAGIKAMRDIAVMIEGKVNIIDPSSLPPKADLADNLTREQITTIWNTQTPIIRKLNLTGLRSREDITGRLGRMKKGETFGWSTMNSLRLPSSGQVIIEGRTGMGKTTTMVNVIALKILQGKSPIIFYSLEQPAEEILLKLTMILDGRVLDPHIETNVEMYRDECFEGTNETYNKLMDIHGVDLFILDDFLTADGILTDLTNNPIEGSLVFLDYAQYVPHKNNNQSRYLIIKNLVERLQNIAKKNNIIIFTGSQLTIGETPDKDSPRECWDINFAADLVIRIWNKNVANTRGAKWEEAEALPGNFVIKVMKNRGGMDGQSFCFDLMNGGILKEIQLQQGEF